MTQFLPVALPQFEAFLIILVRVGGIFSAIPVFGSRAVPLQIKVVLVMVFSLALLPLARGMQSPQEPLLLAGSLVAEFVIGLVLGLAIRMVFAGVELAGELMGTQMGLGMVQLFDPTAAQQVPVISQYQTLLASMVFLSLNMHHLLIQALAASFQFVPPFGAVLSGALVDDVLQLSRGIFIFALKIAAPMMATMFLINLLLAVLGRAVTQINVFLLSFPVLLGTGFFMLGVGLPFTANLYRSEFGRLENTLGSVLRVLGHG